VTQEAEQTDKEGWLCVRDFFSSAATKKGRKSFLPAAINTHDDFL